MVPLWRSRVVKDVAPPARAQLNRLRGGGWELEEAEAPNPNIAEGILPSGRICGLRSFALPWPILAPQHQAAGFFHGDLPHFIS